MSEWKPVQPEDLVHITVGEFEKKYISRAEYDRLTTELAQAREELARVTDAAIKQSEIVQRDWLSPIEASGLREELERVKEAQRWIYDKVTRVLAEPTSRNDGETLMDIATHIEELTPDPPTEAK
jgi:hypothetical protein